MPNTNSPTAIILTQSTTSPGIQTIATMTFDSATEEYSPRTDWTEHPVESGQDVTDHAQIKPLDFIIHGTVTETTLIGAGVSQDPRISLASVLAPSGAQRVLDAYHFLQRCEGQIVTVQTARWGAIGNCGITSYRHPVDITGKVTFTVGVRQIRVATSGTAVIPPLRTADTGASTAGNVGAQAPQPPTEPQLQSTAKFGADTVGSSDAWAHLWSIL